MMKKPGTSIAKYGSLIVIAMGALTLGACSTSSGMMAQGAPITYKLDQGVYQQASLGSTYIAPEISTPSVRPVSPSVPQTLPMAPAITPQFDTSSVDKTLYKHQRVGKRYKIAGKSYTPKHQPNYNEVGTASWYGDKFHGKPTATGERYNMNDITAAHKTLPLNSMVYVTNMETGKGLLVRVNDRGPFVDGRIIDLSRASAKTLGLFSQGLAHVRVQYAGPADPNAAKRPARPAPKAAPIRPAPQTLTQPEPEFVAQAPNYRSLRDLGTQVIPQFTQPKENVFGTPPAAQTALPIAPTPQAGQMYQAPKGLEFAPEPEGDDPITLTIKGPIHMASDKDDGSQAEPKFIPAVNYKNIQANK